VTACVRRDRRSRAVLEVTAQQRGLVRDLVVERGAHRECPQTEQIGLHLREIIGNHLVAFDGLAHRASLGSVGTRHAERGLAQADRLEAHAEPRMVHELEHVTEAFAPLAHELGGCTVEGDRDRLFLRIVIRRKCGQRLV